MDTYDCIKTRIETREFSNSPVPDDVKRRVLEAARQSQSSMNTQHWRFVLVEDPKNLETLARDSKTGPWVRSSNFAVLVLIDPALSVHLLDAGRAVQHMQLAAWNSGVASGVYTGFEREAVNRDFGIPKELTLLIVVAFGYPARKTKGVKSRKPLREIAFSERFGNEIRFR